MASRRQAAYGGVDKRGDIQTLLKTLIKMRTEEKAGGLRSAEDKRIKEEAEKKFERLKKRVTPEFRKKYLEAPMSPGTEPGETLAETLSTTTELLLRRSKNLKEEIRRARGPPVEEQIAEEISSGIEAGDSSTDNDSSVDTSLSSDCGPSDEDRLSVDSGATLVPTLDERAELLVELTAATDQLCQLLVNDRTTQRLSVDLQVPLQETTVSLSRSFKATQVKSSLCATVVLPSCSFAHCLIAKLAEPSDKAISKEFSIRCKRVPSTAQAEAILKQKKVVAVVAARLKLTKSAEDRATPTAFKNFSFTKTPAAIGAAEAKATGQQASAPDPIQRRSKTAAESYCHGVRRSASKKAIPRQEFSCAPVLHLPNDPTGVDPLTGLPKPRVMLTRQPRFLDRQSRVELQPEVYIIHKKRPPPRDPTTFTSRTTVTTSTTSGGGAPLSIELEVLRIVLKKVGPPHSFRGRTDDRQYQHHRGPHHPDSNVVSPFGVHLKRVDRRQKPKCPGDPAATAKSYVPSWRKLGD